MHTLLENINWYCDLELYSGETHLFPEIKFLTAIFTAFSDWVFVEKALIFTYVQKNTGCS